MATMKALNKDDGSAEWQRWKNCMAVIEALYRGGESDTIS